MKFAVQVVVFNHSFEEMESLLLGLAASILYAKEIGSISECEVHLGDCSPEPCFSEQQISNLKALAQRLSIDKYEYHFFNDNLGSSGGSNKLSELHQCEIFLVLNPDTYPSPQMITELINKTDESVGLIDGRQLPMEHPKHYDPQTLETSWASGCCMLIRRDAFNAVNGFDNKSFLLHCDDVDISWRVKLAGFKVLHAPLATLFHDKRVKLNGYMDAPSYEVFYSALGGLFLAHKFNRDDVLQEKITQLNNSDNEYHQKALEEFLKLKKSDGLPARVEDSKGVAQFINGAYEERRF